jgi:hypothetical protein
MKRKAEEETTSTEIVSPKNRKIVLEEGELYLLFRSGLFAQPAIPSSCLAARRGEVASALALQPYRLS